MTRYGFTILLLFFSVASVFAQKDVVASAACEKDIACEDCFLKLLCDASLVSTLDASTLHYVPSNANIVKVYDASGHLMELDARDMAAFADGVAIMTFIDGCKGTVCGGGMDPTADMTHEKLCSIFEQDSIYQSMSIQKRDSIYDLMYARFYSDSLYQDKRLENDSLILACLDSLKQPDPLCINELVDQYQFNGTCYTRITCLDGGITTTTCYDPSYNIVTCPGFCECNCDELSNSFATLTGGDCGTVFDGLTVGGNYYDYPGPSISVCSQADIQEFLDTTIMLQFGTFEVLPFEPVGETFTIKVSGSCDQIDSISIDDGQSFAIGLVESTVPQTCYMYEPCTLGLSGDDDDCQILGQTVLDRITGTSITYQGNTFHSISVLVRSGTVNVIIAGGDSVPINAGEYKEWHHPRDCKYLVFDHTFDASGGGEFDITIIR